MCTTGFNIRYLCILPADFAIGFLLLLSLNNDYSLTSIN
jgi:hypothetical protein